MKERKPSILSYVGFRNLFLGQIVSQFGDTLYWIVFPWLVYEVTGSAGAVGITLAFEALPYVLLSWYAGAVVDRVDRRLVLIWSDVFSAVLVTLFAAIVLLDPKPSLWVVCSVVFLLGCVNVFAAPAKHASTPRLVPEERLIEANALNSYAQSSMPLIGFALGAGLLGLLNVFTPSLMYVAVFLFDALTFVGSALFMFALPSIVPQREDERKAAWKETLEGLRFVRSNEVLFVSLLLAVGMHVFIAPFMPAYVIVTKDVFNGTTTTLAILEAGFFLGMVFGSLVTMVWKPKAAGVAFSVALALAAIPIVPMGFAKDMWTFFALNLICGLFVPLAQVPMNTLVQVITPDGYRGRVNSALSMMAAMVMPLGYLLSGALIAAVGLTGTFAVIGIGFGLTALLGLASPGFRSARLPEGDEPQPPEEPPSDTFFPPVEVQA